MLGSAALRCAYSGDSRSFGLCLAVLVIQQLPRDMQLAVRELLTEVGLQVMLLIIILLLASS